MGVNTSQIVHYYIAKLANSGLVVVIVIKINSVLMTKNMNLWLAHKLNVVTAKRYKITQTNNVLNAKFNYIKAYALNVV